ncbi:glycosyltransferase [Pelagibacterales bacterium SAG-MED50]|nr:glycosyltransferase [Pelagibacterales bacterium SAG-MED50]
MTNKEKIKSLSLVIPCNNEQDAIRISLKVYFDILKDILKDKLISKFEVIVVNNGSTDKTLDVLLDEKKSNFFKIINLKSNYGYTSSYLAGMYHAQNEMIITVSADLHEDPDKIKDMIKAHYSTNKPIMGCYKKRHETFLKNFFSNEYYRFMKIIKIPIIKNHADFRLITKEINNRFFNDLSSFVFIRIRILDFIDSYEKIFYVGNDRKIGSTKFNFISSSLLALDTILFYAKSFLKRIIFTLTVSFWLLFLLSIFLVSKIKVFPILFIISVMLTLFYFYIHIRIKSLENINEHFEVKEIF